MAYSQVVICVFFFHIFCKDCILKKHNDLVWHGGFEYIFCQKEGYFTKGTGEISRKDLVAIKIDRHFSSPFCVFKRGD